MNLNLGCGRNPVAGYVNLDRMPLDGVDVVADLDSCATIPLPFADDTIDNIIGIDLIEHVANPLPLMQELWRIAKPDAFCTFGLPYGSSDDAWEDPTHVRPYFINSWKYFAAPTYYRADYGYRADWQPVEVTLEVTLDGTPEELHGAVATLRNIVQRQTVVLQAVKPCRPADRKLMANPHLSFQQIGR